MPIPVWVPEILGPVADVIDSVTTSGEERAQALLALKQLQNNLAEKAIEYEEKIIESQAEVIIAEAKGESWLQQSWRPIVMLSFAGMTIWNIAIQPLVIWFTQAVFRSVPPPPLMTIPDWVGAALTLGLSGYVVGRTWEKVTKMKQGSNGEISFEKGELKKAFKELLKKSGK